MIGAIAAGVLGAVFVVSGVTKSAHPRQWSVQAAELVAPVAALAIVPYVELVLGAGLMVQWQRHALAVAALVLLVAFTAVVVVRLAQGRHPPCACFGSFSAAPIGWRHVLRNLALIAVAVVALVA